MARRPKTKPNVLEEMTNALAADLVRTVEAFPEEDVPFGAVKLTQEEQLERYAQVRENPDAMRQLRDARGLGAMIEYDQKMNRLYQRKQEQGVGALAQDDVSPEAPAGGALPPR